MNEDEIKKAIQGLSPSDKNGLILSMVQVLYADRFGNLDPDKEWSSQTADDIHSALCNAGIPLPQ